MSDTISTPSSRRGWLALLQWSAVGAAAAVIVACGGGGDTTVAGGGGVGAGGTGITGMVNGFGSVIVGGVRYDDSGITPSGEDTSDDGKLRLGMSVDLSVDDSCASVTTGGSCVARGIEIRSDLAGEVTAATLDGSGNGTITVMGQDIAVTANTFVHRSSTVASGLGLAQDQIVKVHGRRAAASGATDWVATYIEIKAASDAGVGTLNFQFRLAGALTGSSGNYQIGGEPVSLTGTLPSGFVRARITPAADRPAGGWVVTEIKSQRERALEQSGRSRVEVQGYVESATVETNRTVLVINGVDVIVANSNAVEFDDGASYAGLATATGVVEVKGRFIEGQLVATKVELSDENEREFYALASETEAGTVANTFVVTKRNTDPITVSYNLNVLELPITASNLLNEKLEIKGTLDRATGNLIATRIKREN